jgi:hypothetical protein
VADAVVAESGAEPLQPRSPVQVPLVDGGRALIAPAEGLLADFREARFASPNRRGLVAAQRDADLALLEATRRLPEWKASEEARAAVLGEERAEVDHLRAQMETWYRITRRSRRPEVLLGLAERVQTSFEVEAFGRALGTVADLEGDPLVVLPAVRRLAGRLNSTDLGSAAIDAVNQLYATLTGRLPFVRFQGVVPPGGRGWRRQSMGNSSYPTRVVQGCWVGAGWRDAPPPGQPEAAMEPLTVIALADGGLLAARVEVASEFFARHLAVRGAPGLG